MKSLRSAIVFLTRLPLPGGLESKHSLQYSLLWYPHVGFSVGLAVWGIYEYVLVFLWPDLASRSLMLVLLIAVKDAFHMDGLSDWVDGVYGGSDPEQRFEIMADPSLGVMGGLALVCVIVLELAVLCTLPSESLKIIVPLVVFSGTTAAAILLVWGQSPVGKGGLGQLLSRVTRWWFGPWLIVWLVAGSLWWGGFVGLVLTTAVLLLTLGMRRFNEHVLGGVTGDVCGAHVMLVQVILLLLYQACLAWFDPVEMWWIP